MVLSLANVLEDRIVFGRNIPLEINACLQEAVACADDFERARKLFYSALDMQPDQLEVYIALYKFCFYKGHLNEAEQVVYDALKQSAKRGGFCDDYHQLDINSTDWSLHEGAARIYLYSLKALAFICLRKGDTEKAMQVLKKLQELDEYDKVGSSVIRDLAEAI